MMGRHRQKRQTSTRDYAKMLARMETAFGKRLAEDEEAWQYLPLVRQALDDAVNRAAYTAVNAGKSPTRMAANEGTTRQAFYKRAGYGEQLHQAETVKPSLRKSKTGPRELTR